MYALQKKMTILERENERLSHDSNDQQREIEQVRASANKQETTVQMLRRKENELKSQLDEAFKNREDLSRIKTLLSELQRRLEVRHKLA